MKKVSIPQMLSVFAGYAAFALLMQWLSGDWLWTEGLIFTGSVLLMCFIVVIGLYHRNPALLAERFRKTGTGGEKPWDIAVVALLKLVFFVWLLVLPLDKRFGWSAPFPLWLKVLGGIGLLASVILLIATFFTNAYLSPLVRMQEKQTVITGGVYRIVRHPMYLGLLAMFLFAAILCGSIWGIVLAVIAGIVLAIRIHGEEAMLADELDGYAAYQRSTKYRLLPFIW